MLTREEFVRPMFGNFYSSGGMSYLSRVVISESCACSVCSVSLWCVFPAVFHHGGTENTEDAQRTTQIRIRCCLRFQVRARNDMIHELNGMGQKRGGRRRGTGRKQKAVGRRQKAETEVMSDE